MNNDKVLEQHSTLNLNDPPNNQRGRDSFELSHLMNEQNHFRDDLFTRIDIISSQLRNLQNKIDSLSKRFDVQSSSFVSSQDTLRKQLNLLENEIEHITSDKELMPKVRTMIENQKTISKNQIVLNNLQVSLNDQFKTSERRLDVLENKIQSLVESIIEKARIQEEIKKKVSNIDYNLINSTTYGNENDNYVKLLQEQVVRLQDDTFLKMMRNYIINTYIDLYSRISKRTLELSGDSGNELHKLLIIIEEEMTSVGVLLKSSPQGCKFDPSTMTVNHDFSQQTNHPEERNTVYATITPAFIWTLPVEGKPKAEIILRKEEVALFI